MGGGNYSSMARASAGTTQKFSAAPAQENFQSRGINEGMNPMLATLRESRDSEEHPTSIPIIIGLDVTGSMGRIPQHLIGEGLPHMMDMIQEAGVDHAQVMFSAVGDHKSDQAPLQVGQFETSDALMDHWLTKVYLEGNGGGNGGESYSLVWHYAAAYTQHDHWDKRKQKGILITIGDECCHEEITTRGIFPNAESKRIFTLDALKAAQEHYHVYHLNMSDSSNWGQRVEPHKYWGAVLGDNAITCHSLAIPETIAGIVAGHYGLTKAELDASDEPDVSQDNPSLINQNTGEML